LVRDFGVAVCYGRLPFGALTVQHTMRRGKKMTRLGTVTVWLHELQAGEALAVQKLWERYFPRMVEQARRQLRSIPRRAADEEDVALDAFHSFCRAARAGRFPDLQDRHGLWQLLLALTINKAIDLVHHAGRGKRAWRRTALFSDLDQGDSGTGIKALAKMFRCQQPDPALTALVVDRLQWLLGQLEDEQLREIALLKLDGCTNSEIAGELQCALSTVERRLRLIRLRLERHLNDQGERGDNARAVVSEPAPKTTEGSSWAQPS
jgi:DNA-directed RNA polymerase specialized sigma24 family protein